LSSRPLGMEKPSLRLVGEMLYIIHRTNMIAEGNCGRRDKLPHRRFHILDCAAILAAA
jgi:hypothetical protein